MESHTKDEKIRFSRTAMLIEEIGLEKLKNSKIAIFGIGGVGSYVAEALARSGVYSFLLIDYDFICLSNINRQIHSLSSTIGKQKVEVMKQRILDINPLSSIEISNEFVTAENVSDLLDGTFSYAIDAMDNVTAKLALIALCKKMNIPIISSMGAGNKLYPEKLTITDIYNTSVCPLAKIMRKELKKLNVDSLKVCYSNETPISPICNLDNKETGKRKVGSVSFVPSVAGLIIAGEVVRDIIEFASP